MANKRVAVVLAPAPAPPPSVIDRTPREPWVDNLRVAVIAGVIAAHVAGIYALDIGWYYEERTASAVATAVLAGVFSPGLLFGMGLLFFVAGMFSPPALGRKGGRRFVVDRLWRLGLPTVAYLLVVDPLMNFLGDRATGEGETVADYFRLTYWDDVELGVAWFIAALLALSLLYAGWRSRRPARSERRGALQSAILLKAGAFIVVASYVVRLRFPVLDPVDVWGLNLWEYPQMSAMFALGVLATERGWLVDGLSPRLRRTCGRTGIVGVALAAAIGVAITMTDPEPFLGGLTPQAVLIPLVEAMLALGMSLWAIDWFRRRANRAGGLVRGLGRASFAAYLVHAPTTLLLAIALREAGMPAEVKFLAVVTIGITASFGLGWLSGRSSTAGRIL